MSEFLYNASLLNMDDYVQSGEGANGKSFDHKTDSNVMVKLYNESMDVNLVYRELDIAKKVFEAGIPSPKPGDFVTDGQGHYGIRFYRLVGKVSYARAIGNEPGKAGYYGVEFAKMCKQLHATDVAGFGFQPEKEQYLEMLEENPYWTAPEKDVIRKLINDIPDTTTAVHGDLQFGNALLVDGKSYFIDLGEFGMGHPYIDLGMTAICSAFNSAEFTESAFHMSVDTAKVFWDAFVQEYFDGKYTTEQANEMLTPYMIIKSLLIERNGQFRFQVTHDIFEKRYSL